MIDSPVSFAGVMRVFCHYTLHYPLASPYVLDVSSAEKLWLAFLHVKTASTQSWQGTDFERKFGLTFGLPTLVARGARDCSE